MDPDMTRSARFLLPMIRKAIAHLPGSALQQRTVAVDLTPWPAAPPNGICAAAARDWIRVLAEALPRWRWLVLTSPASDHYFANLESHNVRRRCVAPASTVAPVAASMRYGGRHPLRRVCRALLRLVGLPRPPAVIKPETLLRAVEADLLFCPLGATHFHDATVPTVALWGDLTHLQYPQFLPPDERCASERVFKEAVRIADRLVCFSPPARDQIVERARAEASRLVALAARPLRRLPHPDPAMVDRLLQAHGLASGQFVLCPAGAGETANHKLLLTALGIHRASHPDSPLLLVCTGDGPGPVELEQAALRMGLAEHVRWPAAEILKDDTALLQGCRAVLWPALVVSRLAPLLHALEFGKPLLCSDLPGLPDQARAAAYLLDPRRPASLVQALELADGDGVALGMLAQRSRQQAQALGGPRDAADEMAHVLQAAVAASRRFADALRDLHQDGWSSERLVISFAPAAGPRSLRLHLRAAAWLPWAHQKIRLHRGRGKPGQVYRLKRGQELVIEQPLPADGGCLEFLIDPPVQPSALGLNNDDRTLGCECLGCTITGPAGTAVLHPPAAA
jgi:glycosyltransferase involved in cell wall biosynthesis